MLQLKTALFFSLFFLLLACNTEQESPQSENEEQIEEAFNATLNKHLNAVAARDLTALESTMSPKGNMQLVLPKAKISYTTNEFMNFHKEWFKDSTWSISSNILNAAVVGELGIATVEMLYKEPDRNGAPYFNRMAVSYVLQRIKGNWYVIKDHACSLEKSTDSN